jgi:chemotaxis protein methyltransferase CheR
MLTQRAFEAVTEMFHDVSGIHLSDAKRALVTGRLQKLAQDRGVSDVNAYVDAVLREGDREELVRVVDKLTTNETYFFREPQHFDHLSQWLARRHRGGTALRIWSAASSSGEEAYTLAIVLANQLGLDGWSIVGTDLSTAMVEHARRAVYTMERARYIQPADLKRWCLKGSGVYTGQLLMAKELRGRVRFEHGNLKHPDTQLGRFDVIFLRNVLIYFDNAGKAEIVTRVMEHLAPDGLLYTGHAESIVNLGLPVRGLAPSVYTHG